MIIVGIGVDDLISKLRKEIEEIEKELEAHGEVLVPIMEYGRKEFLQYKLLGHKKKPPQGEKLNENPPIILHKSLIVLLKSYEGDVSEILKEYREELENLISFVEMRREEFKDHIFLVVTKGAKILVVYILPPKVPNYEKIRKALEG
ncbi:MAG: hypothetical protein GXO07_04375 [Crenarchaeota archaeon]|nr:hypothetical protein [Thermoproteota archaeon]